MIRNRYHAPNVPPVTAWARHLDAVARAEGLSQSGLFRKLREAVALGPESRSAFLPYLADKEPDETHAKALAAIVGWPPEPEPKPETNEIIGAPADAVAAAIDRQTAVLKDLVAAVQLLRSGEGRRLARVEAVMQQVAARALEPRETQDTGRRAAPRKTAE